MRQIPEAQDSNPMKGASRVKKVEVLAKIAVKITDLSTENADLGKAFDNWSSESLTDLRILSALKFAHLPIKQRNKEFIS